MAVKTKVSAIEAGLAAARDDLDQMRDRIRGLRAERKKIEDSHCDRAETERRVSEIIEQARAPADVAFALTTGTRSGAYPPGALFGAEDRPLDTLDRHFLMTMRDHPVAALAALCPDALADAFLAHHPGGGLSPDAWAVQLSKIERDLQTVEVAEEVAIREIEEVTGGTIP